MKITKRQLKKIIAEERRKLQRESNSRSITKRQLKRIIREEKAKLVSEGLPAGEISYRMQDEIDSFGYRMSKNLNGMLYQIDSDWHNNAKVYEAVRRMLDNIKSEYMAGS